LKVNKAHAIGVLFFYEPAAADLNPAPFFIFWQNDGNLPLEFCKKQPQRMYHNDTPLYQNRTLQVYLKF